MLRRRPVLGSGLRGLVLLLMALHLHLRLCLGLLVLLGRYGRRLGLLVLLEGCGRWLGLLPQLRHARQQLVQALAGRATTPQLV